MRTRKRQRLAGEELPALGAVRREQLDLGDPRLAAPPLPQAGLALGRVALEREQPVVARDRVVRRAVELEAAVHEQHRALAQLLDRGRVVRDEDDRPAAPLELEDLAEALLLEGLVPDGEDLVEEQDVGGQVRRDGEAEAHVHAGRVGADGEVDRALELGERDDLVHHLVDVRALEAVDRAVQIDVLAARELGLEAGAELEQGRDSAAGRRPCPPSAS